MTLLSSRDARDEDDDLDPAVCRICLGPVRICGGARRCSTGMLQPTEQRWVTALRLVYVGVGLTSTPASLWGGAMLRLAARMVRHGALAPSPHLAALALEHADPGGEDPARCAALAFRYLGIGGEPWGDAGAARDLYRLLRPKQAADWLWLNVVAATRAAEATPLTSARFALFTVLCDGCAESQRPQFQHTGTYDEAIRCPGCLVLHAHPIRAVTIGAPHPVGRCLPDPAEPHLCMTHETGGGDALVLDAGGLCSVGRATLIQAEATVADLGEPATRAERALFDAVARAKDVMPVPIVAAVAKIDPDAARELERLPGFGFIGRIATKFVDGLTTDVRRALRMPRANAKPKALTRPRTRWARNRRGARGGT